MKKDDVKAIVLIFLILLLISAISILGIKVYRNIIKPNISNLQTLYGENSLIYPNKNETNNVLVVEHENGVLNQVTSANVNNQTNETTKWQIEKNEYYYEQLNSYSKKIYEVLKNNKENLKTGTYKINFGETFSDILKAENGSQLLQSYYQSAMETYLYDNPDVFYLDASKMYINILTTKKLLTTRYEVYIDSGNESNYFADGYTSKQQIELYENQINDEVQSILSKVQGKNDYSKIQIIHDYLIDNVTYDSTVSKDNIYNIYGALVNKEAVCEGYAKAFKYLMNQIKINSIIVTGSAIDSDGNAENHAWNYVYLDNAWYAVDVTWDDPILIGGGKLSDRHKYQYFLKGSATMNKDHVETYTFVENGKVYTHPVLSEKDYRN